MTDNPTLGQQDATSAGSQFNLIDFIVRQILYAEATATLVQVKAVTNDGGVTPVGFVDVQPLINQIDGAGNATPHGTIYNVPYHRLQGGANAIILDPQVGDIGIAVFASTDISVVKSTKAQANPGSRRRMDMADGLYMGGFLNGTPTQYVQFSTAGINITATAKVTVTDGSGSTIVMNNDNSGTMNFSGGLTINANTKIDGTLEVTVTGQSSAAFTDDVTASGTSVHGHTHDVNSVQGGSSTLPTTAPL